MKIDRYRDGGTLSFREVRYYKDEREICFGLDGQWYIGYPDKKELLPKEEKDVLVPKMLVHVYNEYKRLEHMKRSLIEKNLEYEWEVDFSEAFKTKGAHSNSKESLTFYLSGDGFEAIHDDRNNIWKLLSPDKKLSFTGTKKECWDFYLKH